MPYEFLLSIGKRSVTKIVNCCKKRAEKSSILRRIEKLATFLEEDINIKAIPRSSYKKNFDVENGRIQHGNSDTILQ